MSLPVPPPNDLPPLLSGSRQSLRSLVDALQLQPDSNFFLEIGEEMGAEAENTGQVAALINSIALAVFRMRTQGAGVQPSQPLEAGNPAPQPPPPRPPSEEESGDSPTPTPSQPSPALPGVGREAGAIGHSARTTDDLLKLKGKLQDSFTMYDNKMIITMWTSTVRAAIHQLGQPLTPYLIYKAIFTKLHGDVRRDTQSNPHIHQTSEDDPDRLLRELERVFAPKTMELQALLSTMQQKPGQTATEFLTQLNNTYHTHRCPFPTTTEATQALIPLFRESVQQALRQSFFSFTDSHPSLDVDYSRFQEWVRRQDVVENTTRRTAPTPSKPPGDGPSDRQSGGQASSSGTSGKFHGYNLRSQGQDFRRNSPPRSQGGGPGQPNSGRGTFQGGRGGFSKTQPSFQPPGVNMIAVSTRSPLVQQWSAQQATIAAVGRRPPKPEAHVPGVDHNPVAIGQKVGELLADVHTPAVNAPTPPIVSATTPPAVVTPPLVVPARGPSQVPMYPSQAARRLAESMSGLTMGDLATLSLQPGYHTMTSGLCSLLHLTPVQGVVTPLAPPRAATSTGVVAKVATPISAGLKAPVFELPKQSAASAQNLGMVEGKGTNMRTVPLPTSEITPAEVTVGPKLTVTNVRDVPTPVTGRSGPKSFRDAAKGDTLGTTTSYMVGMPTITVGISTSFPTAPDLQRIAHLDCGASMSLVSTQAYERDIAGLLEHGEIHPVTNQVVTLANGQTVSITEMVKGARIVIGRAFYEVDLFILPGLEHDYLLSAAFFMTYDVTLSMKKGYVELGVAPHEEISPPPPRSRDTGYQRVPVLYQAWHRQLSLA